MKNQLTLFLLLSICRSSWSQNFIKTTTPCTKEFLQKIPAKYIKKNYNIYYLTDKITKQQQQEIFNRLDSIHLLIKMIHLPLKQITGELSL